MSHEPFEQFYICSCHSEAISLLKYKEDEELYISFWSRGFKEKPNWFFRLRQIWKILKTGYPYSDQVVLNKKDAIELSNKIKELFEYDKARTNKKTQKSRR